MADNADLLQSFSDQRRKDFQEGDAAKPVKQRAAKSKNTSDPAPKKEGTVQPAGGARTALAQDQNPDKGRDKVDRTTDVQLDQQKEQLKDAKVTAANSGNDNK
jgi:hypothetical protein